jgi:molybdopterin converting factor small subunit
MKVKFSSPYFVQSGVRESIIDLEAPISAKEFLGLLRQRYPHMAAYIADDCPERDYGFNFLCIGNGRILRLEDIITDGDTVEIVPPIMGG